MSKVMLVTGGARGIGRSVALLAAQRGYDVAIGYHQNSEAASAVASQINATGQRGVAIQADVGDEAQIERMFNQVDQEFGTLDVLVNSAGVSHHALAGEAGGDGLRRLVAVNVTGLMICCREGVKRMSTASGGKGGAIVNISSMAAVGGGRPGAIHYAASKGAVDSYTIGLGKETATQGIRVNAVRPGVTLTDMTAAVRDDPAVRANIQATIPMNRPGEPEEVAQVVIWLASDAASFVTGTFIEAAGGGFVIGAATQ